jgi:hypothetical protein
MYKESDMITLKPLPYKLAKRIFLSDPGGMFHQRGVRLNFGIKYGIQGTDISIINILRDVNYDHYKFAFYWYPGKEINFRDIMLRNKLETLINGGVEFS